MVKLLHYGQIISVCSHSCSMAILLLRCQTIAAGPFFQHDQIIAVLSHYFRMPYYLRMATLFLHVKTITAWPY
jgi:hypothetical protein